jgi:hypothetical protein
MSRETVSVASMILTRKESDMNTVEETISSLTNTMTPHPDFFMSNLNGGSGDIN